MDDVVVQCVRNENQIADVLRIERDLEIQGVLDGTYRGQRVYGGADAAEALGEEPGFARIAAEQDALDAAEHGGGSPGLLDMAFADFYVDAKVAFNADRW